MPGVTRLKRVQVGKEATAGTAVAATRKWGGNGTLTDNGPIEFRDAQIGNLIPEAESYRPFSEGAIALDEVAATYEELPLVFSAAVENISTGVVDTGGAGHIYQFDFPTTAAPSAPKTYTFEVGNDQESDEVEYCFVEEFTLSGAAQEAVMISSNWLGRQLTDCAFTAGQVVPTTEQVLFQNGKIYLDANTLGTTQKTSTLVAFEVNCVTGWQPIYAADGTLYFTSLKNVGPDITGSFTYEHDATGEAERGFAQTGAVRKVRLIFTGATLTTAGSSYSVKTLQIDLGVRYTEVPTMDDQDGNSVYTLPWRAVNDVAPQIIVVNEVANM